MFIYRGRGFDFSCSLCDLSVIETSLKMWPRSSWLVMKYLILVTLGLVYSLHHPTVEVPTVGGLVRGVISIDGSYVQYLGVPYASVDRKHRFQAPQLLPSWDGVFDAVKIHKKCPQRLLPNIRFIVGEEDCLTLNIFKPLHTPEPLPVMVFIHGGGFREGSNSPFLYGPEYLVKKEIVLVIINYRVDILGFLCLGIKEAPGNAGLKDQVMALRWIQKNIKAFGGDPDNVTIFGESSGAASVSYHTLSPMSKGLFHKAIMQSGSSIAPWALQYEPLKTASTFVKQMGHQTEDPQEMYNIVMNKTYDELLKIIVPREEGNIIFTENIFVPCVDEGIPGVEPFLTDTPYNLFQRGEFTNVPVILGYNSAEGYMLLGQEKDTAISELDITKSMPQDLKFLSKEEKYTTATKAKQLYLGDEKITKTNLVKLAGFYGDPFIKYPVIATSDILLKHGGSPVFNYMFSYDGLLNLPKKVFGFGKEPGATHADELFYLFKPAIPGIGILEQTMVDQVTTMWTNFAKFGNPTPEATSVLPKLWLPTDIHNPRVLVIDKHISSAPLFDTDAINFWHETYMKFRRKM